MLILATAKIEGSACFSGYVNRDPLRDGCLGCIYYGEGYAGKAARDRWDIMHISQNDARLVDDISRSPGDRKTLTMKNSVLSKVRTATFPGPINFSQLDNLVNIGGNGSLGHWRRAYEGIGDPGGWIEADQFEVISRLTGERAAASLRIRKVWFEIYLFVLRVEVAVGTELREEWWPYARCLIRAWTQIHSTMPPQDRLLYVKDEVPFIPPGKVEWRGWLGAYSNPPARNIRRPKAEQDAHLECGQPQMRELALRFGFTINGHLAGKIPVLDKTIHGGSVTFNFGGGC